MKILQSLFNYKLLTFCALFFPVNATFAEVSSYDISSRGLYANGQPFGDVGQYEAIEGRIYFEIDPNNSVNQIITDLELAALNSNGMVELSADFIILAPVNSANGNQVALIDIPNRGNRIMDRFNIPDAEDPQGDGFLMTEGYTLVWIGWEHDLDSGIRSYVPATNDAGNYPVGGLGFTTVRDIASWIKYSPDSLVAADYAISFGLSQSGRFLRNYLYLGFNTDEAGRQVYDGAIPHIAGSSRIDLNNRGAQPRSQGQFSETTFPFADAAMSDPVTGVREGALENPRANNNQPKIFHTNSAVEYWGGGRVAALVHTTPDGSQDINLPANVRNYFLAGSQHGPAAFPSTRITVGQERNNPLNYWWRLRALLLTMTDWVVDDIPPPASAHPKLSDQTLAPPSASNFPAIPNVHSIHELDAGLRAPNPLLPNQGGAGAPLPLLVPQVNEDGNEISGILAPELQVPLATYTGWNFNNPEMGDPDRLYPLVGSYIPFAATRAERIANNDPRLSIEERYQNKNDFLSQITAAAEALVAQRYLLERDIAAIVERASQHWDYLMN